LVGYTEEGMAQGSLDTTARSMFVHLIFLYICNNSPNGIFSVVVNNWALVPSVPKIDIIITDDDNNNNNFIPEDLIFSLDFYFTTNFTNKKIYSTTTIDIFFEHHICTQHFL
jgi:hypothetical protein